MKYLPTFGSFLGQMLVNIPHMEHMGVYIIYIYILDRMTSHILGFEATVCTSFATLVPNFLLEACQYSTTGHRNDRNDSGLKYVLCFIFREMIPIDEFFLG